MTTADTEVRRRQGSLVAGVLFGIGWLVFIDAIAHFNACWDRVDYGDPCHWGAAPVNGTLTPHATPSPTESPSHNNFLPGILPDVPDVFPDHYPWDPANPPPATPPPPPPHGGWEPISGRYKIVYVPGILATVALFMVNTVDAKDLDAEHTETAVGAVPGALKLWLWGGMVLGVVSIVIAISSFVDSWSRFGDVKDGPGLAAVMQSIFIVVSAATFFVARSIGSDDVWGQDPLL